MTIELSVLKQDPPPVRTGERRSVPFWLTASIAAIALGCGSGKSIQALPVSNLGQSIVAQQQFKSLEQAWVERADRDRQALEPRFVSFIHMFPSDPETHIVQVWLGRLCLEKDRLDEAWALAEQASAEKEGACFDAAQVLKAAVLTRRGQPERSLGILEPLSGKIVDGRERDTWAREIIRAALQLKHDDDALKWALVWRLESSEDRRASIDREIGLVLDQVSEPALDRLWNQLVVAERIPTTSPNRRQGRVWMREAVLQRLARYAIASRNGDLARRLLNDAWLPLQKSGDARRLTRVAAQGQVEIQNLSKSIGVVLELDDAEGRRRSSELVTGILQTLDQLGRRAVRLQTREAHERDRQGYADAVEDLCNEGVTILVGGFTPTSAVDLTKNAREKGVSAIALSKTDFANELTFWIDTSDQSLVELWQKGESKHNESSKIITDTDAVCSADPADIASRWHSQRVERILVDASPTCTEMLAQACDTAPHLPGIWLGPKALRAADSWRTGAIRGQFDFLPLMTTTNRAPDLEQWIRRFSRLPSYYEVLGHDVAVLTAASLEEFSATAGSKSTVRTQVLRDVAAHLSAAKASLWSSTATGFGPDHSLVPEFQALAVTGSESVTKTGTKNEPLRK